MSSDFDAREPHQPSMTGQYFKLQRNASRRLALQFLYSLDTRELALQAYEQELAKFPERIEEAKVAQEKAAQLPPPVDEEGNPIESTPHPMMKAKIKSELNLKPGALLRRQAK